MSPPHDASPPPGPLTFAARSFHEWAAFWEQGGVLQLKAEQPRSDAPFNAGCSLLSASEQMSVMQFWSTPHTLRYPGATEDRYLMAQITTGALVTTFKGRRPQAWDQSCVSFGLPGTPCEQVVESAEGQVTRANLWQISRKLVDGLVRRVPEPNILISDAGPGALIGAYMRRMTTEVHTLDPAARALFEQQLAALIALAVDIHPDAMDLGRAAMRKAQLDRVLAYIDKRHTDPGLSPATVARTLGISVRYLHRLFESEGLTFSQAVVQRRLATAHRLLAEPTPQRSTVLEIAFASGFNSVNAFYRAFRAAYGTTPNEARHGS